MMISLALIFLNILSANVSCQIANNSSQGCVLFLKFHKVASATVGKVLRLSYGDDWWNCSRSCSGSPFHEHKTLQLFRDSKDKNEILSSCSKPEIRNCSRLSVAADVREPIERVVSQFYSFAPELHRILPHLSKTTIKMLKEAPGNITAEDMKILLTETQSTFNNKVINDGWQNLNLYEYLYTFGKIKKSANEVNYIETEERNEFFLQKALQTLRYEIDCVGVMEHINSFFVLLSKQLDVDLLLTCHEHNQHGLGSQYKKDFGASMRPAAETYFSKEVIEVLQDFTKYERRIWEEAKLVHIEQLKEFNLTIETAESYWNSICRK